MTAKQEPEPTQAIPTKDGKPLIVPVPSREDFDQLVKRVAGLGLRKPPAETDPPPQQSE
jgi:hypothetical protein